jgi:hypothetical protein
MGVSAALCREGEGHNEAGPNANTALRSGETAEWRGALSWRSITHKTGCQEKSEEENSRLEGSEKMDCGDQAAKETRPAAAIECSFRRCPYTFIAKIPPSR